MPSSGINNRQKGATPSKQKKQNKKGTFSTRFVQKRSNPEPSKELDVALKKLSLSNTPSLYSGFVDGSVSNVVSGSAEVTVQYNTFFDINNNADFPYIQLQFSVNDNDIFVIPAGASTKNMVRIKRCRFYALPQFSTTVGNASVATLFSVPAASGTTGSLMAVSQQTTLLTPTAISDWVLVGEYNEKWYNDTQYSIQVNSEGRVALGTLAVINPDTGKAADVAPIQCMAEIEATHTVPNYSSFLGAIATANDPDAWHSFVAATPGEVPSMVQPKSITSRV